MNLMPNIICLSFNGFLCQSKLFSQLEIESAFLEFLVFIRVEAEQLCRAMASGHLGFLQWHEQSETQDFLAKIPLVQACFKNCFVKMLEFGQCKCGRQQLESNWLITDLALQPCERRRHDVGMVECQLGQLGNGKPLGIGRVSRRLCLVVGKLD